MTDQELQDLQTRAAYCVANGFSMAKGDGYVAQLAELGASSSPPEGVEENSPAHLLAMLAEVSGGATPKPKAAKKKGKPEPEAEAPPAAAPPAEAKVEEPDAPKPEPTKPETPKAKAVKKSDEH